MLTIVLLRYIFVSIPSCCDATLSTVFVSNETTEKESTVIAVHLKQLALQWQHVLQDTMFEVDYLCRYHFLICVVGLLCHVFR